VRRAHRRIVFSHFGERMMREAGLNFYYVPHGVDTEIFKPTPQEQARKTLSLPNDRFVVGMVAANKGNPSRKAFVQQISAFAEFHKRFPDTLLYLQTFRCERGENQGVNLPQICEALGLKYANQGQPGSWDAEVVFCDQYSSVVSFNEQYMVNLYSAFDVLTNVSFGEGFGIPILEAQACGCPVIVGDWTSMSELCFSGWAIPKKHAEKYWSPIGAYQYAPHVSAIYNRMVEAYDKAGSTSMKERARQGALEYDADKITLEYWKPVLEDLEGTL
jgi:glycosyltransferase involved in cell wall biosynthesis